MKPNLELGQIFWLIIPLLNKKRTYARPFLIYMINDAYYVLLKITKRKKDYIPQYSLIHKPSNLYEKSFVDSNILVYIEHELFSHYILDKTLGLKGQGQSVLKKDFGNITKIVKECFEDEKYRGNRYTIRVE